MSKLARALTLVAMLAAMQLAGLTAVAQAHPPDQPARQEASRPATEGQVGEAYHRHQATAQQQSTGNAATRAALAQERYYSTWDIGDTPAPAAPAEPSGQPGWLVASFGVLSAVLALVAVAAVVAARRAHRSQRASQAA